MKHKADITHSGNPESKYTGLVSLIETLLSDAKAKVVREVNQTIVFTHRHIGRYIVEYEQGGKKRADYGTELQKRLSKNLTKSMGKGYSYKNLHKYKSFLLCSQLWRHCRHNSKIGIGSNRLSKIVVL
ncbi:MAG: hypothetical protein KKD86_07565 [Bacteroidetes bacterium]|nr:hypothetical protein [Bacteroidota bacterium]MBU1678701.1 hypothetical protein [Bacteroidota bacterium]